MRDTTEAVQRWRLDPSDHAELVRAVAACAAAVETALDQAGFSPALSSGGRSNCEPGALRAVLDRPDAQSDIRVAPTLSDAAFFHTGGLPHIDRERSGRAKAGAGRLPPGRHAEGHRHVGPGRRSGGEWPHLVPRRKPHGLAHQRPRPGERIYLTAVDQPGQSFFRWRDPACGTIETSWDTPLDLRRFRLDADRPLWHCIWAGAPRHSFGYRAVPA